MTLTKRIIPCLDVKNGRVVKGLRFKSIKDAGDPVELAKQYSDEGADELILHGSVEPSRSVKDIDGTVSEAAAKKLYGENGKSADCQAVQHALQAANYPPEQSTDRGDPHCD